MNSDQQPKKPAANKNRAPPKKRPCRTKRQKKFFDEHDESCRNKNAQLKGTAAKKGSGATIGAGKKAKATTTLVASEPKIKKISADDEEAWLEALEKGELDDNGCLPKSRDVTLLTARQKTKLMTATSSTQRLMNNAHAAKEEMSAEDRKKREEKNLRRRLQALKKAEENKRQTIEKLVKVTTGSHHRNGKKSSHQSSSATERSSVKKPPAPMIRYISNAHQTVLLYPPGVGYPLLASRAAPAPAPRMCQVCGVNERKYDCSKSHKALCSLACYKLNMKSCTVAVATES